MFKTTDLSTVVNEFLNTVEARRQKITDKITALEDEAAQLEARIKNQSEELVELEINDNLAGANKLRKSNQELRVQLAEINDTIQGYNAQLEKPVEAKSLEQVRLAGAKARQDRLDLGTALLKESDELEKQIDELKVKNKKVLTEWNHTRYDTEIGTLRRVASYIHPRVQEVPSSKHEELLKDWILGQSVERYFK